MNERKAIIYIRTSTNDQKNSDELQEKQLLEYCKRQGIDILPFGVFKDSGKSGKNTTGRPAFNKMMELIKTSKEAPADMVLVTKLDRFARSTLDLLQSLQAITDKGMKLCTLTETFDPTTPIGKLMISTLASIAEFEREIIRERTQEGYRAAILKGDKICHRPKMDIPKKKVLECIEKGLSASATAKLLGTSPNTIKNRLNDWGFTFENGEWAQKNKEA